LDDINTTLPDSVITHYMKKTGFIVNDPKLVKIISIASQKFISEIVNDVMQHHKLKNKASSASSVSGIQAASTTSTASTVPNNNGNFISNATTNSSNMSNHSNQPSASSSSANVAKSAKTTTNAGLTLTLEDLSQVLTEYGINVKKPYYFM
jgi:hypothetical protein